MYCCAVSFMDRFVLVGISSQMPRQIWPKGVLSRSASKEPKIIHVPGDCSLEVILGSGEASFNRLFTFAI